MACNFIFITGGVVSSLGKGIAAAGIAATLESKQGCVTMLKMDPYINVDPGTMNPNQHGEVFVTDDGTETDLDLGYYERFISAQMSEKNNFTAGKVYETVIEKERAGGFDGETIQVIPHITDEIIKRIRAAGKGFEYCIVEVGGTVGDIESLPFMEAIRQLQVKLSRRRTFHIHVTLVPYLHKAGEIKTKPTQHSVKELLALGLQPNMLLCRCNEPLPDSIRQKIALFTQVPFKNVVSFEDIDTVYRVPLLLYERSVAKIILKHFDKGNSHADMRPWRVFSKLIDQASNSVSIAIIGKYLGQKDTYKSIVEALTICGYHVGITTKIHHIDAETINTATAPTILSKFQGVLVPGGFGDRGIEGKIATIHYARTNNIPFFGICLGLQTAVIEFSRNVLGLVDANSTEQNPNTNHPVIVTVEEWQDNTGLRKLKSTKRGGTMRKGGIDMLVKRNTTAYSCYKKINVRERHRHRWEVNAAYIAQLAEAGMIISCTSTDDSLVEMIEVPEHPWFVASQFHPEFSARPMQGHPLFQAFISACTHNQSN